MNREFSDWCKVSSGVPQGSVLGPILFLIYINNLDEDVKCKISKFADNTKIANRVISLSQQQELQSDLNTLGERAVDSQMFFNVDRCKVLHIGNRNCHPTPFREPHELDLRSCAACASPRYYGL